MFPSWSILWTFYTQYLNAHDHLLNKCTSSSSVRCLQHTPQDLPKPLALMSFNGYVHLLLLSRYLVILLCINTGGLILPGICWLTGDLGSQRSLVSMRVEIIDLPICLFSSSVSPLCNQVFSVGTGQRCWEPARRMETSKLGRLEVEWNL